MILILHGISFPFHFQYVQMLHQQQDTLFIFCNFFFNLFNNYEWMVESYDMINHE